jgi:hypothetical protein
MVPLRQKNPVQFAPRQQFNNLYVLPAKGGELYQLTNTGSLLARSASRGSWRPIEAAFGNWDHFEQRWSPDGEWIVLRRVYLRPVGTLEGVVKDGDTGSLASARIYLRAADGKTYVPSNAHHRIGIALEQHLFQPAGDFRWTCLPETFLSKQ